MLFFGDKVCFMTHKLKFFSAPKLISPGKVGTYSRNTVALNIKTGF